MYTYDLLYIHVTIEGGFQQTELKNSLFCQVDFMFIRRVIRINSDILLKLIVEDAGEDICRSLCTFPQCDSKSVLHNLHK